MRRVRSLGFFLPLLFVVLIQVSTQNAAAQVNRASITGTVTDSTGAVVAGAEVTATNTGTNVPTKTVSNRTAFTSSPTSFPVSTRWNSRRTDLKACSVPPSPWNRPKWPGSMPRSRWVR